MDGTGHLSIRGEGGRKTRRTFLLFLILSVLLVFSANSAWACKSGEPTPSATHTNSTASSAAYAKPDHRISFSTRSTSVHAEVLKAAPATTLTSGVVPGGCCAGSGAGSFCAGFHCTGCGIADLPFEGTSDIGEVDLVFIICRPSFLSSTAESPDLRPPIFLLSI